MNKIVLVIVAFLMAGHIMAQKQEVSATKISNRIDVLIGNNFFTSYRFQPDEKYPFFFPVNGPVSGGTVTSMRNGVYPHHSSLFFGCDRVNGGNYWQEGLGRGQIVSIGARIVEAKGERVVIEDECIWKRPDAQAPIIDRRKITISSPSKDLYLLDFDIEMEMLMDVTILKTNHSLFSARVDADLTVKQGGVMINSEGKKGERGTFGVGRPDRLLRQGDKQGWKALRSCSIRPIAGSLLLGLPAIMDLCLRLLCIGLKTGENRI